MVKRLLISAGVAVVVLGAVTGFAASLTPSSDTLGSGSGGVSACNSTATVGSYTTSFSGGQYVVTGATLSAGPLCAGKSYSVTLTDGAAGNPLATATGTLASTGSTSPAPGSAVLSFSTTPAASAVNGVVVTISG
ncbi:MAG TPA: hypothetical protein VFA11_10230 [Acidimicrobiales bacterium]|nr:hypothetical protein [Acidimicrobiales bacterium]